MTGTPASTLDWEFYLDSLGCWRWTCRTANLRVVGASSEGYWSRSDCEANAALFGFGGEHRSAMLPMRRLAPLGDKTRQGLLH